MFDIQMRKVEKPTYTVFSRCPICYVDGVEVYEHISTSPNGFDVIKVVCQECNNATTLIINNKGEIVSEEVEEIVKKC